MPKGPTAIAGLAAALALGGCTTSPVDCLKDNPSLSTKQLADVLPKDCRIVGPSRSGVQMLECSGGRQGFVVSTALIE